MIPLKTPKDIETMKEGGRLLADILNRITAAAKPGANLLDLEELAVDLIAKTGGKASFKMVPGYRWATCLNVNRGIVHGVPFDYRLKPGDLFSVDAGVYYQGFHSDAARSLVVPSALPEKSDLRLFLAAGKRALKKAIAAARPGHRVGHLSQAIEKEITAAGFQPVKDLTGHGVGRKLHESPSIPGFLSEALEKTPALKPGMVLAIEVIYASGSPDIVVGDDDWTVETADGSLAGLFEETVAVTAAGPLVLTRATDTREPKRP